MAMSKDLYNPASLCNLLQTQYGRLNETIAALGIHPEIRLNGTPYYNEQDVELIRSAITRRKIKQELLNHSNFQM
jgi:hypothetical protein